MKTELTFDEYKRLFIRFCKQEGSWVFWKKYFKEKHTFDAVISLCLPNVHDERRFDEFNIGNDLIVSTPYNIDCKFKRFTTDNVYFHLYHGNTVRESQISRISFVNFLKKYIKENK